MIGWTLFAAALAQDARTAVDAHGIVFVPQNGELVEPLATYRPTRPCTYPASGGVFLERAESPLVLRWRQEDGSIVEETGLDDLTAVNLGVQVACHPIVNFGVSGPIYLGYTTDTGHHGLVQGDPRVTGAVTAPTDDEDEPFRWALVGFLDFPFGPPADHVGRYRVSGGLVSAWSWTNGGPWAIAANLGGQILPRARLADARGGPQLLASVAAGRAVKPWLGVGAEIQSRGILASTAVPATHAPTELLLHARVRWKESPWITAGGAAAVLPGPGAATWRVFVGTGIGDRRTDLDSGPVARGGDADRDGLVDELCPDHPEIVNGWKDDDGCPDSLATLTVRVLDRDTGQTVTATVTVAGVSRDGGTLQLSNLMPGETTLEVSAAGYVPFSLPLTLGEGAVTQAVYLERAPGP